MGTYNSAVITNGGQSMIAQAVAGASLEFTTIKTSSYAYPAGTNLATLTTINGIKQSKDITGAAVYNSRVIKISAAVDNTGISTAYTINTIGIYAKVGSSAESLFAVVTASAADTMPAYDNKPYSYIYEINLTMQNAANVTVTVNTAGLVNVADLNAAKVEIQGEIADLKSAIAYIGKTVIIEANLVTEHVTGKYVKESSGKIVFTDDASYSYAKVDARGISAFTSTQGFSNNFSFYAKKDGTALGKVVASNRIGTDGYVYSVPSGTEVIYLCSLNLPSDIVVLKGETPIQPWVYSIVDYPYDTPYKTTIPTLVAGSDNVNINEFVDTTKPPFYANIMDWHQNLIDIKTPTSFQGSYVVNDGVATWSTSTQYHSVQFVFASNNKVVFKSFGSNTNKNGVNAVFQYQDSNGVWQNATNSIILDSTFDLTVEIDCPNLTVYHDAVAFRVMFIIATAGDTTVTINTLSIREMSAIENLEIYDEQFDGMMANIQTALNSKSASENSSFQIVSPNGTKYIIGADNNGGVILIPVVPRKTLFCGNSLLLGMNTGASNHQYIYGMCASAPENDFCHKTMASIEEADDTAVYDRVHGAAFEQLGTADSFSTLWNTTANIYTGEPMKNSFTSDLDLIIIQLGDNVNDADRRTAFANNIDLFIQNIRSNSPKARLLWVYGWFNNSIVAATIENACKKWGITPVNISSLNTTANQGYSGQTYITGDGGTAVVPDRWITHPGDNGMEAIANLIIERLGI